MAEVNTPDVIPATNASNTTRYFHLPLFISTDKPSWLVDWNGAMGEIDTILQNINTASEGAVADVQTIQTQIDALNQIIPNLEATVQTAVSDVAAMQTTVASHESRLDTVEQDLITQNNLVKQLSDAVVAMQSTVATLNNRVQVMETALQGVEVDVNTIRSQITSLDNRVTALENAPAGDGMPSIGDLADTSKFTSQIVGGTMTQTSHTLESIFTATEDCYAVGRAWVNNGTGEADRSAYAEVKVGGIAGFSISAVAYGSNYQTVDVPSNIRGDYKITPLVKLKAGDSIYRRGYVSSSEYVSTITDAVIFTPVHN